MTITSRLHFPCPEPPLSTAPLVPVFLPFAGCPGRCIFCDQHAQTGQRHGDLESAFSVLTTNLEKRSEPFALGFFGGTFTGLDEAWQDRFLELAARIRTQGMLKHLRLSTRPDRVDPSSLDRLRGRGVDMVELGVQTFETEVLEKSGRGYGGECAAQSCAMVRDAGLELGIQLLPGLPGHDPVLWRRDVQRALGLQPAVVRIYPCVVMAETGLEAMYIRGTYLPWSLEMAVAESGWALLRFWERGVRVIRLGLAAEGEMLSHLVAGPWHPAFGNMVRSWAVRLFLHDSLSAVAGRIVRVFMPLRLQGDLWGHERSNEAHLARLGIHKGNVTFWSEPDIALEMEA